MDKRKTPGDKSRITERLRNRYVTGGFLLSVRYPYLQLVLGFAGDNVVAEVPPIPEFKGHPTLDSTRAQRFVMRMGKLGTMVYIGHLDLMHVFERALRRAAIPVRDSVFIFDFFIYQV